MKRIISTAACILLCFSLGVSAFAGDFSAQEERPTLRDCMKTRYSEAEVEAISSAIAAAAECCAVELPGDIVTVWIALRITANPELANLSVFRESIRKIVERSRGYAHPEDYPGKTVVLLDNIRAGGELALHIALVMLLDLIEPVRSENLDMWYERFDYAELNLDEYRIPAFLMEWTGVIVMDLLF